MFNIIPPVIAQRIQKDETLIADKFEEATVVFIDMVNFTQLSSQISPESLVQLLNTLFSQLDQLSEEFQLEKIKTIGDCYMVVSGIPKPNPKHIENALDFCNTVMKQLNGQLINGHAIQLRIGVETGPTIAGVIGKKRFLFDLWGDTVNIASRMESNGLPNKIHTTEKKIEKMKNKYSFSYRGKMNVKGKGEKKTYFLN